jgi:hypothetical protein
MNVSAHFKNGIRAFEQRREKVKQNGWRERKYEVSNNSKHYTDYHSLMQAMVASTCIKNLSRFVGWASPTGTPVPKMEEPSVVARLTRSEGSYGMYISALFHLAPLPRSDVCRPAL